LSDAAWAREAEAWRPSRGVDIAEYASEDATRDIALFLYKILHVSLYAP